ncbi:MAG: TIM barrel protein [Chthonomonadales bacterium]|nr:TIM barrel protein [Chthonomonadales bacterium]
MGVPRGITRRAALAAAAGAALSARPGLAEPRDAPARTGGRIRQGVSRWCYGGVALEDLCRRAKEMGIVGIDLLSEPEWATVKAQGLVCSMANGPGGIADGWNTLANHERLVAESERLLPLVAAMGWPNMILLSGNRRGLSDDEGIRNCVTGIKRIIGSAERLGVTLCMELLNSKRDHKDYQCDHTAWGVQVVKQVGSERFKLLYDIYHMQIMEGDVVATIRENLPYIAHFHTGGVPGRNEIDATQELNYRRVCQAIADGGFTGFVAHEFIPKRDPMASLAQAVRICDV